MQNTNYSQLITGILNNQPTPWPENQANDNSVLFIESAQQHGVLALLDKFKPQLENDNWPIVILQTIAVSNKAAEQILAQRREKITSVFKVFSENNVDALIFKGAANAYLLYPQPNHRTHADIDILIRESQFMQVKQSLCAVGFEFDNIRPSKYGPSQSNAILRTPGTTAVTFDIHWKINNRLALANTLEFDELNHRAIPIQQYGGEARAFSYADAVLAACIHEAGSLDSERGKLISLYDVYLLLGKLDTQALNALTKMASEKKIGAVYSHYLYRCLCTFEDSRLAERVNRVLEDFKFQKNEITAKLLKGNRSWTSNQWLDLCSVNGTSARLEFMIAKLKRKF